MRWIAFLILLYLMSALQVSHLGGIPAANGELWPRIEFLPLLAVFYALYAAEPAATLAALVCGLMYDLRNSDYLGTSAIPLALVALGIARVRLSIFREHFVSQVIVTLLSVLAFALLSAVYRKLIGAPLDGGPAHGEALLHVPFLTHLGKLAANAVYTAIIAPILFWLFFRFPHLLGFTSHGPRTR
jgi:rod shape-determining protein MreD